jgi:E3 ubiquitin-protein ligase BAH
VHEDRYRLDRDITTNRIVEFDKRTSLDVATRFPTAVHSDRLLSGTMAKNVCAQISNELVSILPQIGDYACPVCLSIAYLPIRLACQHVFCIRCIVKIQRRKEKNCPLCRSEVVMKASAGIIVLPSGVINKLRMGR